jgi:hypothetical protein
MLILFNTTTIYTPKSDSKVSELWSAVVKSPVENPDMDQSLGEQFARLMLAIDEHLPGYVDSFFGPVEWKEEVKRAGKIPLPNLIERTDALYAEFSRAADFDPQRKDFGLREMDAMKMSLRLLSGEKVSLADEVTALYDVTPQWKPESVFEEAQRELSDLLPAGDNIADRLQAWNKSIEVTNDQIRELLPVVVQKLRGLTREKFNLPAGEDFTLEFVTDQPWSAYNWYRGSYQSLIQLSVDLPVSISRLPDLIAHEGYPGHHTELCIKEEKLINENGWDEFTVNLINAPSCVLNEGIATTALDTIMSKEELTNWFRDELLPRAHLSRIDAERLTAIVQASGKVGSVTGNAAFMLHDSKKSADEIVKYLQRYGMYNEKQAQRSVKFITNPLYRSYIFTYYVGKELLSGLFAQGDRDRHFARLLAEPVNPTMVREWIGKS